MPRIIVNKVSPNDVERRAIVDFILAAVNEVEIAKLNFVRIGHEVYFSSEPICEVYGIDIKAFIKAYGLAEPQHYARVHRVDKATKTKEVARYINITCLFKIIAATGNQEQISHIFNYAITGIRCAEQMADMSQDLQDPHDTLSHAQSSLPVYAMTTRLSTLLCANLVHQTSAAQCTAEAYAELQRKCDNLEEEKTELNEIVCKLLQALRMSDADTQEKHDHLFKKFSIETVIDENESIHDSIWREAKEAVSSFCSIAKSKSKNGTLLDQLNAAPIPIKVMIMRSKLPLGNIDDGPVYKYKMSRNIENISVSYIEHSRQYLLDGQDIPYDFVYIKIVELPLNTVITLEKVFDNVYVSAEVCELLIRQ